MPNVRSLPAFSPSSSLPPAPPPDTSGSPARPAPAPANAPARAPAFVGVSPAPALGVSAPAAARRSPVDAPAPCAWETETRLDRQKSPASAGALAPESLPPEELAVPGLPEKLAALIRELLGRLPTRERPPGLSRKEPAPPCWWGCIALPGRLPAAEAGPWPQPQLVAVEGLLAAVDGRLQLSAAARSGLGPACDGGALPRVPGRESAEPGLEKADPGRERALPGRVEVVPGRELPGRASAEAGRALPGRERGVAGLSGRPLDDGKPGRGQNQTNKSHLQARNKNEPPQALMSRVCTGGRLKGAVAH